ncbi:MAG: hydrolase [Bdellovibrionaceae bacterium]|nr:hydrolase [Pseudobdellovibrionaceae bacterium]
MEIRDPIHGSIELSKFETKVIDSRPYQRLRSIKQLGFSEFSFPGATHNRYLHSIGVCHLSGQAFDSLFKQFTFSNSDVRNRFRQCVRLAALLHDIGHGPLSHTTEEVMPQLKDLNVSVYANRDQNRQANHEDYTIKFLTDSSLSEILSNNHYGITPMHVACLVDKSLAVPDDFFKDQGIDFRILLSQIVSSEMDVDRMDYLGRDAYFCGTSYGKVELNWLLAHLDFYVSDDKAHLALNRRALYSFDDFLLARHHMHLMVYFHHKSVIYEELLHRYLTSKDCQFFLPADIEEYTKCNDYALFEHLANSSNSWAQRIARREPYKVVFELHSTEKNERAKEMEQVLQKEGFETILASSTTRLSKYHTAAPEEKLYPIYVVDHLDPKAVPYRIEESTEIFDKYEEIRKIERLYVAPEDLERARLVLANRNS